MTVVSGRRTDKAGISRLISMPGPQWSPFKRHICLHCQWWDGDAINGGEWKCHRYPPTVVKAESGDWDDLKEASWSQPTVFSDQWCGEYKHGA